MKKVLVLFLVLSLVSLAQAGLKFDTALTEVQAGSTITINLVTETGTSVNSWGFDAITGSGTASNPVIDAGFESQTVGSMNPATGLLAWYTYANDTQTPTVYQSGTVYSFDLVVPTSLGAITIATMFDDVDYLSPYYIDITDGYTEENFGSLEINVIPEPITLALLGLGALFIRRK